MSFELYEPPRLDGRTVVITGATSGIGASAARVLCGAGADVVLVVRDRARGAAVAEQISSPVGAGAADVVPCDLSSFASVRAAAQSVCSQWPAVDVLINNAGLIAPQRTLTEDGNELTFQVNHLSHFLLTNLLRPALVTTAPSRVVTVSSDAHFARWRGLDFDDLSMQRGWAPFRAYSASKLANILFARELASRWAGSGVSSNALHPGNTETGFGQQGWGFGERLWKTFVLKRTPERGADTLVWAAAAPELEGASGLYLFDRRPKRPAAPARSDDAARRLWAVSLELTGLTGGPE